MNHEELKATIRKYAEEEQVFFNSSEFSENSEQEVYLAFQAVQNEGPFKFVVTSTAKMATKSGQEA